MFDNTRLKELERLSNSIEGLLAVCQADTERIKRECQLDMESKVQKIFDCLDQYYPILKKYQPYIAIPEFRYKDNLFVSFDSCYGRKYIHVTLHASQDSHGVSRLQEFTCCKNNNLSDTIRSNETFIDFVNNWDKYFPTFEDSFISEINKAIQKKIKITTGNRSKELQILNSIKNVECVD